MHKKNIFCLIGLSFFISYPVFAAIVPPVARVIILKGEAFKQIGPKGKPEPLKMDEQIMEGTSIKTGTKGFVKLMFADKSQVNISPSSQMVVNKYSQGSPGVIDILNGQVRAKVEKDLLEKNPSPDKSKLFIRTKTAAMGIRGTDFEVIYNDKNNVSSVVTFEGEVAMVRTDNPTVTTATTATTVANMANMMTDTNKVVLIREGQFSSCNPKQEQPTVPTKISPAQLETMKTTTNNPDKAIAAATGTTATQSSSASSSKFVSPVAPGMDPKTAIGTGAGLMTAMASAGVDTKAVQAAAIASTAAAAAPKNSPPPEGFFDKGSGKFAPPAGGFVDMKTGLYVPPPPGSTFDANAGVYVPPPSMGGFDTKTGSYIPPQGFALDANKGFVAAAANTATANTTNATAGGQTVATTNTMSMMSAMMTGGTTGSGGNLANIMASVTSMMSAGTPVAATTMMAGPVAGPMGGPTMGAAPMPGTDPGNFWNNFEQGQGTNPFLGPPPGPCQQCIDNNIGIGTITNPGGTTPVTVSISEGA